MAVVEYNALKNGQSERENLRMTWRELNDRLRKPDNAEVILKLYKAERKGHHRKRWLIRIYCRYSTLRRKKEMKAVTSAKPFV